MHTNTVARVLRKAGWLAPPALVALVMAMLIGVSSMVSPTPAAAIHGHVDCTVGVAIDIQAFHAGTDDQVGVATDGTLVEYEVTVSLGDNRCPIEGGTVELELPDGTVATLEAFLEIEQNQSITYPRQSYTIDENDTGNLGAAANAVRSRADVEGTSHRGDGQTQDVDASANWDITVVDPDISITKSVAPDEICEGVETDVTYTFVVTNEGDENLVDIVITDTVLDDAALQAAFEAANLAENGNTDTLDVGQSVTFTFDSTVTDGVDNTVTATADGALSGATVDDDDDATVTAVECTITISKTGDDLSKVGDDVTYNIEVCNTGDIDADKVSVTDSLIDGVNASFGATLVAGACEDHDFVRTVQEGDPDPLVNTATAIYSFGGVDVTETDSHTVNLFQPSINVTKVCDPSDTIEAGQVWECTITIENTSSADTPDMLAVSIDDTLTGDLLDPANTAVTSTTCGEVGDSLGDDCTIVTEYTVQAEDTSPLTNMVTAVYSPVGFPNQIDDDASASVTIETPGLAGCTPGFWRQPHHFEFWTDWEPTDDFSDAFDRVITVREGGRNTIEDPTLLEALEATGGGINALARHAVAALLNATSPDVDYPYTEAQIIAWVQAAIDSGDPDEIEDLKNLLEEANELGCTVDKSNE